MRLLNSRSLKIREFSDTEVRGRDYAILSHTWGNDEVTFEDIEKQEPSAKRKEGYDKLLGCCRQARADGHHWVWVDTCCINKQSQTELSEAIISMYAWYRDSRICYVYLEDVYGDRSDWKEKFAVARWFTRGWCLQELIAPSTVEFYDANWKYLGTKGSLGRLVRNTTGIPTDVLNGRKEPTEYSIGQRMSWASCRDTKKIEDKAYCLLGILGSKMPPKYGEGEDAFVRLQQEVFMIQGSDDYSVFLWTGDSFSHSGGVFAVEPSLYPREGPRAEILDPNSNGRTITDCDYRYIRSFRDYQTIGRSLQRDINWKAAENNNRGIQVEVFTRKIPLREHKHPALYMWSYCMYETNREKYLVCIMLKPGKYGFVPNVRHRRSHRKRLFLIPDREFSSFELSKLILHTKIEPTSMVARNKGTLAVAGVTTAAVGGLIYKATRDPGSSLSSVGEYLRQFYH